MSFSARELLGGTPRYLYTFVRAEKIWRLTNVGSPVTVAATGLTYAPAMITHGRMERSSELRADAIAVSVSRTTQIADALKETRMHPMALRIEKHQPADAGNVPIVLAFGDVAGVRFNGGMLEFDCVTGEHRFGEAFPSKLIERQCQWPTYSAESGIDEAAFSFTTTIAAITRSTVEVADIGHSYTGYYNAGQLQFGAGAAAERVFVDYHEGTVFHIVGALPSGVVVGDAVTLIAGDDNTLITRRDRFGADAVDRFLGFDLLPTTDPLQTGVDIAAIISRGSYNAPIAEPSGAIRVYPRRADGATDLSITLTIIDPESRLVSVEFRSNSLGFPATWSAWAAATILAMPGGPGDPWIYGATGTKGAAGYVAVETRVTATSPITGLPVTTSATYEATSGYIVVLASESGGFIGFGVLFVRQAMAFVAMTANATTSIFGAGFGDKHRLTIDATAGPFTLTFAATDWNAPPEAITNYLNGVLATSMVVNGYVALQLEVAPLNTYFWTTL